MAGVQVVTVGQARALLAALTGAAPPLGDPCDGLDDAAQVSLLAGPDDTAPVGGRLDGAVARPARNAVATNKMWWVLYDCLVRNDLDPAKFPRAGEFFGESNVIADANDSSFAGGTGGWNLNLWHEIVGHLLGTWWDGETSVIEQLAPYAGTACQRIEYSDAFDFSRFFFYQSCFIFSF